ncbi:MAG: Hpt domain-containing protein [Deltaproteobacteria bacterium]|nr:Hpt domain-containing protein [Deltaproteobacteria bacterium]
MADESKKIVVHIDPDLEAIIPRFIEIREDDMQQMREALGKGDFDSIVRIGHSMKGAGGSYGFDGISKIGAAIESAGKEEKAGAIEALICDLARYIANVEIIYDGES